MSFFDHIVKAPPNAIFHTTTRYKNDSSKLKVNLGVGAYRDENGKPWILPTVLQAETEILEDVKSGKSNHEYLPITGLQEFVDGAIGLVYGKDSAYVKDGRVQGVQALSGTGALRLGATFVGKHYMAAGKPVVYLSDPTWSNHVKIFNNAQCETRTYRYYDPKTRGLDLKGMLEDLSNAPRGSVILLHACAHNPTGVDPSPEEWKQIRDVVKSRRLFPFFDTAYQGFASGSPERDAIAIRIFAESNMSMLVAQSFAKNFGLYNERAGVLHIMCQTKDAAIACKSRIALIVRAMYSNPPNHGARIVAKTFSNPKLYAQWQQDIRTMSGRINKMRHALVKALKEEGAPGTWNHITDQIGMFSYTGLTPQQVQHCEKKYSIYMLSTGRISMAGLNESNVQHVAKAIADAVKTYPFTKM